MFSPPTQYVTQAPADAVKPRVGVRGKPGAVLAGGPDVLDGRFLDQLKERKHVIPRNAEHMLQPEPVQAIENQGSYGVRRRHHVLPIDYSMLNKYGMQNFRWRQW